MLNAERLGKPGHHMVTFVQDANEGYQHSMVVHKVGRLRASMRILICAFPVYE
jgi:hypothetical protein